METRQKLVTAILVGIILSAGRVRCQMENFLSKEEFEYPGIYQNILQSIFKEFQFNSLVCVQGLEASGHLALELLHRFDVPKIICTREARTFLYKDFYNSEILMVLLFTFQLDTETLLKSAEILDYMRQSRLLILAENILSPEEFREDLRGLCAQYKMTNVFLMLTEEQNPENPLFWSLRNYPEFYWQEWRQAPPAQVIPYYPIQWYDFQNISLRTYVDQDSARTFVYKDAKGEIRMNGFVAKFIILFAQTHNASLEMPYPLQVGKETHFTIINQMVADNELDLPMAMIPGMYSSEWRDVSDTYDLNQIILMVPLSHKFSMQEIFGLLLNAHFFCCFLVSCFVLTFCHGFIEHWRGKEAAHFWDWLITERVWPGLLGQSFGGPSNSMASLKIIYLTIGLTGLYMATRFSANMNMYINKPPYHPQIRNYDDLRESKLKILIDVADSRDSEDLREFIVYTTNTTYLHENRRKLNASYCYYATTATYQVLLRQQRYSSHFVFHTPKSMAYFSMLPWGFRLQHNSPYREALNEFIHNVHSAGLIHAWHDSLFWDMLKLKKVSIHYKPQGDEQRVLTASDLFWVWMVIPMGLSGSFLVFLLEVLWGRKKVFKRKISLPQ
ncbi:uncharacterized protein LOC133337360 [Musca vetustissima]|uniref:uncharacterized protein LOC133337360 n=1 Tax=Musca vetustissima TaxID=27455 RepID=UPI002AB62551|nr:uncharacterized protein LOC133337360 [Musca vetustissima]